MDDTENYNKRDIYVTERLRDHLRLDAEMFEIYKPNKIEVNMNNFLSRLLIGYNEKYDEEMESMKKQISSLLKDQGENDPNNSVSEKIVNMLISNEYSIIKSKKNVKIAFKPTIATKPYIKKNYFTSYFREMLESYAKKPMFEREKIIFSQTYDDIEKACRNHDTIGIYLKNGKEHIVKAYKITHSNEEMFNYLLCQEMNKDNEPETKVYRLNRIERKFVCNQSNKMPSFGDGIIDCFKKMEEYGPQFAINRDIKNDPNYKIIVHLSKEGMSSYKKIYLQRPRYKDPKKIPKEIEKNGTTYFEIELDCSEFQAFLYFRRFNPGEAEIMEPQSLRQRMIDFHQNTVDFYKKHTIEKKDTTKD